MLRKKFLALLAAVALACGAVGCKADTDTGQVDTNAETLNVSADVTEVSEKPVKKSKSPDETLAQGEERDWKIEDVMKNDLEIDGISISIPCTVGELLDTLGKNYSFDEEYLKKDLKYLAPTLYYKGEKTDSLFDVISEDNVNYRDFTVCGVFFTGVGIGGKGVLTFKGLDGTYKKFLKKYPNPDELETKKTGQRKFSAVRYYEDDYYFDCTFSNDILGMIDISIKTGEDENE